MEQTENIQTPISPGNNVRNSHFSTKKLIIGVVLILVLATVFVLGMGYESKSNRVGIVEKPPVKTVVDDMNGWKTYTSKNLGVSFSYPSTNYLITKDTNEELVLGASPAPSEPVVTRLTISTKAQTDLLSIPLCDGSLNFPCNMKDDWGQKETVEEVLVDNKKMVSAYIWYGGDNVRHYVQNKDVPNFEISMQVAGGGLDQTFKKILSTFKFVEKQTYDTSLTYDNTSIVILNPSLNRDKDTRTQPKKYNFKYPSKDVLSVDMILDSYSEVSGISINLSNGVSLTLKPSYEGVGVDYRDKKPDVKTIVNTNFPEKLSRILNQYTQTSFTYVSNYGEGGDCSQWSPLPLACHMSGVFLDKIGGFGIVCNTSDTTKVEMCDEIVKYLDISVEETQ